MTADDVRALLQAKVDAVGTVKGWADANSVSPTFVGDVLKGYKQPSDAVLKPLGLRRVVTYEREEASSVVASDPTSGVDAGGGRNSPSTVPLGA